MCGIVGYVGHRHAQEFLLEGLRRLEYRGYDSAGIGTITPTGEIAVAKTPGRIEVLAKEVTQLPATSAIGRTQVPSAPAIQCFQINISTAAPIPEPSTASSTARRVRQPHSTSTKGHSA